MLPIEIKNNLSEAEETYLQSRWNRICEVLAIPKTAADNIYDQVHFEYADWSRAYHNLSHIHSLLQLSEQYQTQLKEAALFDMAIWFHDYIYDTGRKDNEAQSAHWAKELLMPYLKKEELNYISSLILCTEGHQPRLAPENTDQYWLLDFDLAVLETDKTVYKAYSDAIREEYKSLFSYFTYNIGRKKVMKGFLKRKTLYFTEEFQEKYETIARENIEWEIRGLKES